MLPTTIHNYGAPFVDSEPVSNPETQQSADQGNAVFRDVAQMTRTSIRAWCSFKTSAGAPGVLPAADVASWSIWGDGASVKPAVEKTATGLYKVTYASSYVDELDVTEPVSFVFAQASHMAASMLLAPPPQVVSVANNVVEVAVMTSAFALDDHGGDYTVVLAIR